MSEILKSQNRYNFSVSPEEKPKPKEVKESKVATKPSPPVRNSSVTKKQNQQRNEEIKKTQTKITDNNKTTTLGNNLIEINKINETNAAERKSNEAEVAKEAAKVDTNVENKLEAVPGTAPQRTSNEINDKPEEKPAECAPVITEKAKETPVATEGNGAVEDESAKGKVFFVQQTRRRRINCMHFQERQHPV